MVELYNQLFDKRPALFNILLHELEGLCLLDARIKRDVEAMKRRMAGVKGLAGE